MIVQYMGLQMILDSGLVIGIDPGTKEHNLGIAIIDTQGSLVYCDEISGVPQNFWSESDLIGMDKLSDKLVLLESRFAFAFSDIRMFCPGKILIAGIEDQWVGKNPQGTMTLSKQFGVIFGIFAGLGIYSIRIQPTQAKKALTGNGKATKSEMLRVANMVGYNGKNENAADAAGVALAALEKLKEWKIGKLAV